MSLESALRGSTHRAIASGAPVEGEIRRFPFFMEGITLQMTNPMLIMFFVSLFPQFIDPKLSYGAQYGILAATYGILILAIHSGYSFVTSHFRGFLSSERMSRLIYRIGGSIFIVLALKVLWDVYVSLSAA
jgi:homoserine/homoserine lactone efflux protein